MSRKRKRKLDPEVKERDPKRLKDSSQATTPKYPILLLHYYKVSSLREYLLSSFPKSNKSRRKRIDSVARWPLRAGNEPCNDQITDGSTHGDGSRWLGNEKLSKLLDTTIIGYGTNPQQNGPLLQQRRKVDMLSQRLHSSIQSDRSKAVIIQHELVDVAVEHLLHRMYSHTKKPMHALCNGLRSDRIHPLPQAGVVAQRSENIVGGTNAAFVSTAVWQDLLDLLGRDGDKVMLDLILYCGIFIPAEMGQKNLIQLSGRYLSALPILARSTETPQIQATKASNTDQSSRMPFRKAPRNPSEIVLIRPRMLYARAGLNSTGNVRFGLSNLHVFNRHLSWQSQDHVVHVMKYMFPRQFGLHNVFTSTVAWKESAHRAKDYTLREGEIAAMEQNSKERNGGPVSIPHHLPKRLRGSVPRLVARILKLHSRCSYAELLKHYCPNKMFYKPIGGSNGSTGTIADLATPSNHVSAFCRAVLSSILPLELFGSGDTGRRNCQLVLKFVHTFVSSNRHESLTLQAACEGLKVSSIGWLTPPTMSKDTKMANSDFIKRKELLQEVLYFILDSILIPLLRSSFYITECSTDSNRLFFFRHDVWKTLTEPKLVEIKTSMFRELTRVEMINNSKDQAASFGQLRLVPKGAGFRPIMNLRRRAQISGQGQLRSSVNAQLMSVHGMLKHEKDQQPTRFGASMLSISEIHSRLKNFHSRLRSAGKGANSRLYFAKVDVKSCFDTIPQDKAIKVVESLCLKSKYRIDRHAELRASDPHGQYGGRMSSAARSNRKFVTTAHTDPKLDTFTNLVNSVLAQGKKNTVFLENGTGYTQQRERLLVQLGEHIRSNVVKIGNRLYQQERGIPQGSMLSSILCSFFYANFEEKCLGFLANDDCLLIRMIDDFLLITTDAQKAIRFLQVMHAGNEDYGISVQPSKTLTNFACRIHGFEVAKLPTQSEFPYCGLAINTLSLEVIKDASRQKQHVIGNTLTVDPCIEAGTGFYRRSMGHVKSQIHAMYTDTSLNAQSTVVRNLYHAFLVSAMKIRRSLKSLETRLRIADDLIRTTISDLIDLAWTLVSERHRGKSKALYECAIGKNQMAWLLAMAFGHVLGRKQSRHAGIIPWLDNLAATAVPRNAREADKLREAAHAGNGAFRGYRY